MPTKNDALQLASRFSLPPNSLGYCGKESATKAMLNCIKTGECNTVSQEISEFIILNPYLETLSKITGKSKYDYQLIESYWIGNDLLLQAKKSDYNLLLDNFIKQGVPSWLAKELSTKDPQQFIPNHTFQVLHVGVGRASGSVPFNLDSVNQCLIRWGKVLSISNNMAKVHIISVEKSEKSYLLVEEETQTSINSILTPQLKKGDNIALHWGEIIKVLTKQEAINLKYWTSKTISALH